MISLDALYLRKVMESKMINNIKKFLRENKFTRDFYKILFDLKHYKVTKARKKKRKMLQKNGIELIHTIQNLLAGEFFFFDMGTLLGIIREGRLLGHDLDVDIGVVVKDFETIEKIHNILIHNGCEIFRTYRIDEIGVVEESFMYNNIKFDIGYYYTKNNQSVIYLMYKDPENPHSDGTLNVVELSCPLIESTTTTLFKGEKINIPSNAEFYLEQRYGENWRIPDKNYIYWKGPSAKTTDFSATVVKHDICSANEDE